MDIALHMASMLKTLRQEKGWSLSQAAAYTGVSKAMLGQIERQESSPSIAILWKIATGFNVHFSLFLPTENHQQRPVFSGPAPQMTVEPLFPYDKQLRFDHFSIHLAAGASSQSSAHDGGVIEHVVVIEGRLSLQVGDEWYNLRAGEGKRFAGDIAHGYYNPQDKSVHFHSLIHYPAPKA